MKIKALERPVLACPKFRLGFIGSCLILLACGETDGSSENQELSYSTNVEMKDESVENALADSELPQVEIPEGYEILSEVFGDLDADGVNEKVIVFNTDREGEIGAERELRIYAENEGLWSLWHTAVGPILSSERGGVLGDPFEEVSIRNGMIVVSHFGGSKDRWSYSHSYKYVDEDWRLAEANLIFYNVCDYSETFTYDLVRRNGYHSRQKDECDQNGSVTGSTMEVEESLVLTDGQEMPLMNGFLPGYVAVSVDGNKDGYRY